MRILVILVAAVIASVFVEVLLVVCGCTEFVFLKLVFRTHSTKEKLLEFLLCCYSLYCCFCYKGLFSFVMPTIQSIKMVGLLEMNLIKIFMPLLPVPLWNSREALVCWQIVGICFDVAFQATSDEKHVFLQSILVLLFGYYSIFSFFFFAQPILRTIPIILSWFESLITNREAAIAAAAIAVKEDSDEIHATLLLEEKIRARERAEEVIDLVNDNDDEQAEERRIGSIAKPSQWGEGTSSLHTLSYHDYLNTTPTVSLVIYPLLMSTSY